MRFNDLGLYPIDHTVYGPHTSNAYSLLCDTFWQQLNHPPKRNPEEPTVQYTEAYFLFILSLQLFSFIGGKNSRNSLERLTTDSLRDVESGWLYLPHYHDEIPKRLSPISRTLGMSLLLHLSREQDIERHHLRPLSSQYLDAPLRTEDMPRSQRPLYTPYGKWIKQFGKTAKLASVLYPKHLRQIVQIKCHQQLPTDFKPWIELQLDLWPHNPAPISQWAAFRALDEPLDFSHIEDMKQREDILDRLELPKWLRIAKGLEEKETPKDKTGLTTTSIRYLIPIKEIVHEYDTKYENKPSSAIRGRYRRQLERIAKQAKTALDNVLKDATLQDSDKARELFHIFLISGWLATAFKGRGLAPSTPISRFYQLQVLLRIFPSRLLTMLEVDELDELFDDLGLKSSTINAYVTTLDSLRQYAEDINDTEDELKVGVTKNFDLQRLYHFTIDIHPVELLTRPQLEEILGCLLLMEDYHNRRVMEGQQMIEKGQSLLQQHGLFHKKGNRLIKDGQARIRKGKRMAIQASLTYYGALLQISFALRSKSALHVRINGLTNLDGAYPSVLAPPTKGRKAFESQIPVEHLDEGALAALEAFRQERLAQANGDGNQYLLAAPDGTLLSYHQYRTTLERAMQMTGNRIQVGGRYASTHLLRHYAANRWLALGVPLRLIRDYMNHRQDSTTVGSYLHAVSFKLADLLFTNEEVPDIRFTQRTAAFLLGISPSDLRKRMPKEEGNSQRNKFSFGELCELVELDYAQIPPKKNEDREM